MNSNPSNHGHVDIAKNQIDPVFLEDTKRLGAVAGLQDLCQLDAGLAQRALHDLSHHRGVVNDEGMYVVHGAVSVLRGQTDGCLFRAPS